MKNSVFDVRALRRRVGLYGRTCPAQTELFCMGHDWRIQWNQNPTSGDTAAEKRIVVLKSTGARTNSWTPSSQIPRRNAETFPFNFYCRQRQPLVRLCQKLTVPWAADLIGDFKGICTYYEDCAVQWDAGKKTEDFRYERRV